MVIKHLWLVGLPPSLHCTKEWNSATLLTAVLVTI